MKHANVFVDVDLTLIDGQGRLLPGAREALVRLRERGCHFFLWSSLGVDYARQIAEAHRLADLFEGFASKPDIVIDDMPGTTFAPIAYNIQTEPSWPELAAKIIKQHVD